MRRITFQPLAKADMMKFGDRASDSLNSIVYLSRTLISLTALNRMLRGMLMPSGGLHDAIECRLYIIGGQRAPSPNRTPLRRKKV